MYNSQYKIRIDGYYDSNEVYSNTNICEYGTIIQSNKDTNMNEVEGNFEGYSGHNLGFTFGGTNHNVIHDTGLAFYCEKFSQNSSICSALYAKQANEKWGEITDSESLSCSCIIEIKNMLARYCDLGIQPQNFCSQESIISLSHISTLYNNQHFSYILQ